MNSLCKEKQESPSANGGDRQRNENAEDSREQ